MRTRLVVIIGLLLVVTAFQSLPAKSIPINMDTATFRGARDSVTSVEIFYSFSRSNLSFKDTAGGFDGLFTTYLSIQGLEGKGEFNRAIRVATLEETHAGIQVYDRIPLDLEPGKHLIELKVFNSVGDSAIARQQVSVPLYGHESMQLSGLRLCSEIVPDTSKGLFVENGYRLMPNPSGEFGQTVPMILLYDELYNLKQGPRPERDSFHVTVDLLNVGGGYLKTLLEANHPKRNQDVVFIERIPSSRVRDGEYFVRVIAQDNLSGETDTARHFMRIMHSVDGYNKYLEGQWRMDMVYLAGPDELNKYEALSHDGKASFHDEFFSRRAAAAGVTLENALTERRGILAYVNQLFSNNPAKDNGWETDQGRVYLQYGPPNSRESESFGIDSAPVQTWSYSSIEGGVIFVFADAHNLGQYNLVHSTKKGELSDALWKEKLQKSDIGTNPREKGMDPWH